MQKQITVEAMVNAPVEKVWEAWTDPMHIVQWAFASEDWEAPYADNDVRVDGTFKTTMAAKDGSASFDFEGKYTLVIQCDRIEYVMSDGRAVSIHFERIGDTTKITQTFDMENENPEEMQREGWQAILNNFKKYTEENCK
jgi:uncharacterized protein YndB with AHSA1/START domain